jgi:hypothetical protein
MPKSTPYQRHSFGVLKTVFPRLSVHAIEYTFKIEHNFRFTPSFESLLAIVTVIPDDFNGENDDVRAIILNEAPFLQHVGHIVLKQNRPPNDRLRRKASLHPRLRQEIANIPELNEEKENRFLPIQPKEKTMECGCCMEDVLKKEMVNCGDALPFEDCHFFCRPCLQRHVGEQLYGKNQTLVKCMSLQGCANSFGEDMFTAALSPRTRNNFDILRTQVALKEWGVELW